MRKLKIFIIFTICLLMIGSISIWVYEKFNTPTYENPIEQQINNLLAPSHSTTEIESNARYICNWYKSELLKFAKSKNANSEDAETYRAYLNDIAKYYNLAISKNYYRWGDTLPEGVLPSLESIKNY